MYNDKFKKNVCDEIKSMIAAGNRWLYNLRQILRSGAMSTAVN
jgi:hypothetical protein